MSLRYIKRKRNPLISGLIVGSAFFVLHLIISLIKDQVNLVHSLIGAAVFFVLYFIFQAMQNIRISRMKRT